MHPSIHLILIMQSNMPGAVGDKGMSQKAVPILAFWKALPFPSEDNKPQCSSFLLGFHLVLSPVFFLPFFWPFVFFRLFVFFSVLKV